MDTHCQTVVWNGSNECQNLGAVRSFESKRGGGGAGQSTRK